MTSEKLDSQEIFKRLSTVSAPDVVGSVIVDKATASIVASDGKHMQIYDSDLKKIATEIETIDFIRRAKSSIPSPEQLSIDSQLWVFICGGIYGPWFYGQTWMGDQNRDYIIITKPDEATFLVTRYLVPDLNDICRRFEGLQQEAQRANGMKSPWD